MNVSLTPELQKFVEDKVATGLYSSASEVVRAGLRILEEDERWRAHMFEKVQEGLRERAEGKMITKDEFLADLKERRRLRA